MIKKVCLLFAVLCCAFNAQAAVVFGNTSGTDFNKNTGGSGADVAVTKPTADVSGVLVLFSQSRASGTNAANGPMTVANATGGVTQFTSNNKNTASAYGQNVYGTLGWRIAGGSEPAAYNINVTTGSTPNGNADFVLVFTGFNSGTPIRVSATSNGNGATMTCPDTASINDGDLVLRIAMWKDEGDQQLTTTPAGTIIIGNSQTVVGDMTGQALNYSIKSGAGAPGTAAFGLASTRDWITFTVVIAGASAAGSVDGSMFLMFSSSRDAILPRRQRILRAA